MSGQIEYREYRAQDFESFHALHDAVFPPVSADQMREWMARPDVTAGVAVRDGEVLGEIPLHIREFVLRPGVTARLAFEHSVCVREELRGQGVGSALQDAMKDFLVGRADCLAVFRGGERTPGYRYYDKNGLRDTCYLRSQKLADPSAVAESDLALQDISQVVEREAEVLAVFASAFGAHGGYEQRRPGFFGPALRNLQWLELQNEFGVYLVDDEAGLAGYCIVSPRQLRSETVQIMELATREGCPDLAERLVRSACSLAADQRAGISVTCQDGARYSALYAKLGFVGAPRGAMIMVTPVDWEGLAAQVWQPQPQLEQVRVDLWTAEEEVTVHRPEGRVERTLVLEMKHHQAVRWLVSRLDLGAAVRQETVSCLGAGPEDLAALARAIPFNAWAVQTIDHI